MQFLKKIYNLTPRYIYNGPKWVLLQTVLNQMKCSMMQVKNKADKVKKYPLVSDWRVNCTFGMVKSELFWIFRVNKGMFFYQLPLILTALLHVAW